MERVVQVVRKWAVEWHERRARLNHDVLCNRLLTRLVFLQEAEAPKERDLDVLRQWLGRRQEYLDLIAEAPEALSPVQWLDDSVLSGFERVERERIRQAAQFLVAVRLSGLLSRLRDKTEELDRGIREYLAQPARGPGDARLRQITEDAWELSAGLSNLKSPFLGGDFAE